MEEQSRKIHGEWNRKKWEWNRKIHGKLEVVKQSKILGKLEVVKPSRKILGKWEVVMPSRIVHGKQKVSMRRIHGNCETLRRTIHDKRVHDYDEKLLPEMISRQVETP